MFFGLVVRRRSEGRQELQFGMIRTNHETKHEAETGMGERASERVQPIKALAVPQTSLLFWETYTPTLHLVEHGNVITRSCP